MESEHIRPATEADGRLSVGVIGTGNMGSALVRGWARASVPLTRLLVWDTTPAALERVAGCEGVAVAGSLAELVEQAELLVIVVKPKDGEDLLRSLAPSLRREHTVVSAMAGVELRQLRLVAGPEPALLRVMPNLGVEVGAGMVAVSAEKDAEGDEALRRVTGLFGVLGAAVVVPEVSLDVVTAVSGTGPALLALVLEGMEDGGVAAGLPRFSARMFARGAMLGTARLLLEHGRSSEELEERLAPAGDVMRGGVELLEGRDVRGVFQEAVVAAARRARDMRAPSARSRS